MLSRTATMLCSIAGYYRYRANHSVANIHLIRAAGNIVTNGVSFTFIARLLLNVCPVDDDVYHNNNVDDDISSHSSCPHALPSFKDIEFSHNNT